MNARGWLTLALGALAPALVAAQGWSVPTAPGRVLVQRVPDTPWPSRLGVVTVATGALEPARLFAFVTTTNGQAVGSRLLWAAPGEPATVVFDTSSGTDQYHVYLSAQPPPVAPVWTPDTGVLIEVRAKPPGPVNSWAQMEALWRAGTNTLGRGVLTQLYNGVNPFGPARDFMAYYRASLRVEEAGDYALATISGDASFVFVNGKLIAEWPGAHPPWEGRRGRFHGRVKLAVGSHVVEYYHAHLGSEPLAALAWRRPGREQFEIVPPAAFGEPARFQVAAHHAAPWAPAAVYFEAEPVEHSTVPPWSVVTVRLSAPGVATNAPCQWTFDDGASATGARVEHVFARPGLRTVKLRLADGREAVARVNVRPVGTQIEEWPAATAQRHRQHWLRRDVATLPLADLGYLVEYASAAGDHVLLDHLGAACLARAAEFDAAGLTVLFAVARHYQDPVVRQYARAEAAYRAALARPAGDAGLRERVTLRLAELLAHRLGRAEETPPLLAGLTQRGFSADEKRLREILLADAALATGDLTTARQAYAALTPPPADGREAVRRRARLEAAQVLLAKGDLLEAERQLREIEWQRPLEKISLETGPVLLQLALARQEHAVARQQAAALLLVATGEERAPLLLHLAEIYFALGQEALARRLAEELVREYPFSEPAARAKDRWAIVAPSR